MPLNAAPPSLENAAPPSLDLRDMARQILRARKITRADQAYFMQLTTSINKLDDKELISLNQLFDALQNGRVRVVD